MQTQASATSQQLLQTMSAMNTSVASTGVALTNAINSATTSSALQLSAQITALALGAVAQGQQSVAALAQQTSTRSIYMLNI